MSGFFEGNNRRLYHREYSVSDGSVRREEAPNTGSVTSSRTYHSGLTVGSYSYILSANVESDNRVRVIRLCEGSTEWDNWYDIQLICSASTESIEDLGSILIDANFLTVEDGVSEAMLVITVKSEEGSSDTCSFPLSSIDSKAAGLLEYCQNNMRTLPFPWMTVGACDNSVSVCRFHGATISLPLFSQGFHTYT
jgi:hypothetical protein